MPADAASPPAKTDPLKSKTSASEARAGSSPDLQVALEHSRSKHLGWAIFGLVAGVALLIKLGTIGQAVGILLIATALYQGYQAVLTFMHPPGTFKVSASEIVMPTGLCRGRDLTLAPSALQHAFLLRRAVPWTMAGPLLVVESGGKSYAFPRDWFASDSDQRRVERALNRGRVRETAA